MKQMLSIIFILNTASLTMASEDSLQVNSEKAVHINMSLGFTRAPFMPGVEVGYRHNKHLFLLNYFYEFSVAFIKFPAFKSHCISLLYGKDIQTKNSTYTIAAGPGLITGTRRGEFLYTVIEKGSYYKNYYKHIDYISLGLTLEAQKRLSERFHLSAVFNLNPQQIIYGLTLKYWIINKNKQ